MSESERAKLGSTPLPCIVCGAVLESVFAENGPRFQPYAGTMFDAGPGHYGSTVWDTVTAGRSLSINVCDPCLTERADRVAVVTSWTPPPNVVLSPWTPDRDDEDDS